MSARHHGLRFVLAALCVTGAGALLPRPASAQLIINLCSASAASCKSSATWSICSGNSTFVNACAPICDAATVALSDCKSETWTNSACGAREMSRLAGVTPGTAPATVAGSKCYSSLINQARDATAFATRLMPKAALGDSYTTFGPGLDNAACENGAQATCNARHKKNPRPFVNRVVPSQNVGARRLEEAVRRGTALVGGQTALENTHATWRANGAFAETCDEYVFHKYEGYSLFEDATLATEGNARAAVDVAFTALAAGNDRRRRAMGAVGGIEDWAGRRLRGDDLFPSGQQPKNAFTGFEVEPATTRLTLSVPGDPTSAIVVVRDESTVGLTPTLIDAALAGRVNALLGTTHAETLAWHGAQRNLARVAEYSDEMLERMADLRDTYLGLMAERNAIVSSALHCHVPQYSADGGYIPSPIDLLDPSWDPSQPLGQSPQSVLAATFAEFFAPMADVSYVGAFDTDWENSVCRAVLTDEIRHRLARVDLKLEAVLKKADAVGCFDAARTHCDWAPSDFHRHVRGLFVGERQAATDQCVAGAESTSLAKLNVASYTSRFEKFRYLDHRGLPVVARVLVDGVMESCDDADYRINPTKVEKYFACQRAWTSGSIDAMKAALGPTGTVDMADPTHLVKQSRGDTFGFGNDLFGAKLAYDAGWSMANLRRGDICGADLGVKANATVTTSVFGASSDLLSVTAGLQTGSNGNGLAVRVMGTEVYAVGRGNLGFDYAPIVGSQNATRTFFSLSQYFTVGPVPVKVTASAVGRVGFDYDLSVQCAGGGAAALAGSFRPFAGVEAQASGSVSAFIAEAGIKIGLTMLELSLPIRANVVADTADGPNGTLRFDTQAELMYRMLDGYASLYAEICYAWPIGCESWDYELASWGGLSDSTQLFRLSWETPTLSAFAID